MKSIKILFLITSVSLLAACGSDTTQTTTEQPPVVQQPETPTGTLSVDITDAAADTYSQIWVQISKVTATHVDTLKIVDLTSEEDKGSFNLLSLQDFATRLATIELDEGIYSDIKVYLEPGSKITTYSLQGDKKEVALSSSILPLYATFEIIKDQQSKILIDFDLDQWEVALNAYVVDGVVVDVSQLPLVNSSKVKNTETEEHGIIIEQNGQLFLTLPGQGIQHLLEFDENTDITKIILNQPYDIEGIAKDGRIVVEELELLSMATERDEREKIVANEIKLVGSVVSADRDADGLLLSFIVNVNKSSVLIDGGEAKILVNDIEDTTFSHGVDADVIEGALVKVVGEALSDATNILSAYKVTIRGTGVHQIEDRELFRANEFVKCVTDAGSVTACEIEPNTNPEITQLVVDSNIVLSETTMRCLDSGKFIKMKIMGHKSTDGSLYIKRMESEQRCQEEERLIEGNLVNYTADSCVVVESDNSIQTISSKLRVLSYFNGTTDELLVADQIVIKTRSNGEISIEANNDQIEGEIYLFLGLDTQSAGFNDADIRVIAIGTKLYVYDNVLSVSSSQPTSVLDVVSFNGFMEVTNSLGHSVVMQDVKNEYHFKPLTCNLQIQSQADGHIRDAVTDDETKWFGITGELSNELSAVLVVDENSLIKSIRFDAPELTQENLEVSLRGDEDEQEHDRLELDMDDLDERQRELELDYERENTLLKTPFNLENFKDDMQRLSEKLFEEIVAEEARTGLTMERDQVISILSDMLTEVQEKIQKKLEGYILPAEQDVATQEAVSSIEAIDTLYDYLEQERTLAEQQPGNGDMERPENAGEGNGDMERPENAGEGNGDMERPENAGEGNGDMERPENAGVIA